MYSTNRGSGVVGRLISRCSSHLLWPAKAAAVKEQTVRVTAEDADAGSKNARARYMQAKHKLGEVCPDYPHVESPMTREQSMGRGPRRAGTPTGHTRRVRRCHPTVALIMDLTVTCPRRDRAVVYGSPRRMSQHVGRMSGSRSWGYQSGRLCHSSRVSAYSTSPSSSPGIG
jgi:hypothetical protein